MCVNEQQSVIVNVHPNICNKIFMILKCSKFEMNSICNGINHMWPSINKFINRMLITIILGIALIMKIEIISR